MELIPAIDIIDGQCVRLSQGNYDTKKVYGNPVDMACRFEELGFKRLHVVDLDGAKSKHVVNLATLRQITKATNLRVDFGGGVKTADDMERVLEAGAELVTVGSVAVTHPDLYIDWLRQYGAEHIILGADVRNGKVSINGWLEDSTEELPQFLNRYMEAGTRNVLCTEISRDGMLQGPAIDLYRSVMEVHPTCHLIASGGVGSMADIEALEAAGIPAVVVGKAFYEGALTPALSLKGEGVIKSPTEK